MLEDVWLVVLATKYIIRMSIVPIHIKDRFHQFLQILTLITLRLAQ